MASSSLYKSLTALSFVCFALSLAVVFIPIWGYFEDSGGFGGFGSDRGYFGPWNICKELTFNRQKCGSSENVSRFRPSKFVLASGVMLVISTIALGIYCILTAMQLMGMTRGRSRKPNSSLIETRLVLAGLGGKLEDHLKKISLNRLIKIFLIFDRSGNGGSMCWDVSRSI